MTETAYEITPIEEIKELFKAGKLGSEKPTKVGDKGGQRIKLHRIFDDGKKGPIIVQTPPCFTFGVSENVNEGAISGYSMAFSLHDAQGITQEQREFIDAWDTIYEFACQQALQHKGAINRPRMNKNDVTGSVKHPVYKSYLELKEGEEEPQVDSSKPPKLYPKLETSYAPVAKGEECKVPVKKFKQKVKKEGGVQVEEEVLKKMVITTEFFNQDTGEDIEPLSLIGRNCTAVGAIVVDSLWVGTSISLQLKLRDCGVQLHQQRSGGRLLKRPEVKSAAKTTVNVVIDNEPAPVVTKPTPTPTPVVKTKPEPEPEPEPEEEELEEEPEEELEEEAEEEPEPEPEPKPEPKKVTTRKVVRKKTEPKESADNLLDE